MKPIVRYTIGPVAPSGFDCLYQSIIKLKQLYDVDIFICYNGCSISEHKNKFFRCLNQSDLFSKGIGVAWKLYPARIDINRHELFIDNDLIIEKRIEKIDNFFNSDTTLLLEGAGRNYGSFSQHVPRQYSINSGIFGVPPGFNLQKYINFFGEKWDNNVSDRKLSVTWNEQGLVATSLLSYKKFDIISNSIITNCSKDLHLSDGMHFIGLNRENHHRPWLEYKHRKLL